MKDYYHVGRDGSRQGPVTGEELHRLVQSGLIGRDTPIWRTGWESWRNYSDVYPQYPTPPPLPPRRAPISRAGKLTGWLLVLVSLGALLPLAMGLIDTFLVLAGMSEPAADSVLLELAPWGAVCLAGAAVALWALIRRRLPKGLAGPALFLNLMGLFFLVILLGVSGGGRVNQSSIFRPDTGPALTIAPIEPAGAEATGRERDRIQADWYRRHLLSAWLDETPTNTTGYAESREVLELSVLNTTTGLGTTQWDRFHQLFRAGAGRNPNDPFVILAFMDLNLPWTERAALLTTASDQFRATGRHHALQFLCAKLLADARFRAGPGSGGVDEADDRTLEQLVLALDEGSYLDSEWAVLSFQIASVGGDGLVDRRGAELVSLLQDEPSVPEWLSARWAGNWELKRAWRARGGGYARDVTDQGWRAFFQHSETAARYLERSWELQPQLPFAASDLCHVMLGLGDYEDMRKWFDRTIEADFDYGPVYGHLLWGLRPRWHGSHQAMLDFGRACAATGRYETWVPWRLHEAVHNVISETRDPRALLQRPDVYEGLLKVYDGYARAATNSTASQEQYSWMFASAVLGGHWEDAERFLEELEGAPALEVCRAFNRSSLDLVLATLARGDSRDHPLNRAVGQLANGRYSEATTLVSGIQERLDPTRTKAHRWLDVILQQVALREQTDTGGAIGILDGEPDLFWEQWVEDARTSPDGDLELSTHMKYQTLLSRLDAGQSVLIEGTFSVNPPGADFELLLEYGNHYQFQNAWRTVRFRRHHNQPMSGLGQGWGNPTHTSAADFESENHFVIKLSSGEASVVLNDREVVRVDGLNDGLLSRGRNQLAISFGNGPDQPVINLRDVRLRHP